MAYNIPSFPYWLGTVIRGIAHFIREGMGRLAAIASLGKAYSLFDPADLERASYIAEDLVAMASNYDKLGLQESLSSILEGTPQPGDETYINFYVHFTDTGSEVDSQVGRWRTVQWRGPWSTTREDIERQVRMMMFDSQDYDSERVEDTLKFARMDVGSLIWFQHPEQL